MSMENGMGLLSIGKWMGIGIAVVGNVIAVDGIGNGIPDDRFGGRTYVGDGSGDAAGRNGLTNRRRTGFSESKRAAKTSKTGFQDSRIPGFQRNIHSWSELTAGNSFTSGGWTPDRQPL